MPCTRRCESVGMRLRVDFPRGVRCEKGSVKRSRNGSFFSAGGPGITIKVGELRVHKEREWVGVVQRDGARSSTSRGLGSVPGNVEGNLRFAYFTI